MQPSTVLADPYRVGPGTWVVPQLLETEPGVLVAINSMVITATEPVIVDTGTSVNRERWLAQVRSIVDPADVRWVFLSHADRDHIGNLAPVLEACPNATVVTTMWGVRHMLADGEPPLARMRWVNDGESFSAGDRVLHAVRPPVWDNTNTRGLYDPTTGVFWAADCFASMLTAPVTNARDLDPGFWRESFAYEHSSYCDWHTLLDATRFNALVDRSASLQPSVVASAHGPVLTGRMIDEAYAMVRELPGRGPVAEPGQPVLERMLSALVGPPAAAA